MRTNIGPYTVTTHGYDVEKELLANGDPNGVVKYMREKKQKLVAKARQYLAETPQKKYYVASGHPYELEDAEDNYSCLIPYTDEEVERIKQLVVEAWNQTEDDPEKFIHSFDDFHENLYEVEKQFEELDQLLWHRAEEQDFCLYDIDLSHPVHAYRFRAWEYDSDKGEMCPYKNSRLVVLTDEEYLYLLVEQLFDRHFSFNRLLLYNAPLAQKINDALDGDYMLSALNPYLILMDEVLEDTEKIIG